MDRIKQVKQWLKRMNGAEYCADIKSAIASSLGLKQIFTKDQQGRFHIHMANAANYVQAMREIYINKKVKIKRNTPIVSLPTVTKQVKPAKPLVKTVCEVRPVSNSCVKLVQTFESIFLKVKVNTVFKEGKPMHL
jgi:hypothetical protein